MPLSDAPSALSTNPLVRIRDDLSVERRATRNGSLPPGPKLPSIARTERMRRDPLAVLLPAYEEHGPIFAIRIFHAIHVFMLGPEANRFILVTDRDKFRWRDGSLGDLIPLIGDGLLTTDGEYHDRAREIMVPVFHRKRIAAAATVMAEEAERALDGWRTGDRIDLYDWTRHVAMRVAMRALFGLDPDRARVDVAATFERGLSFYEREYFLQVVRGPGSPFARLRRVRRTLDRIILSEIAGRRSAGEAGEDILGLLMEAEDSEGMRFTDEQVRDQVLTLLFAGHDTTTSTVAFLFYELARHPRVGGAAGSRARQRGRRRHPRRGAAVRRAARAGDGRRRDAPPLPARVDRPPPRRRGLRVRRLLSARGAAGELLVLGEPQAAGRVQRSALLQARALRALRAREAPQGRLRPVRRRAEDLHRDALRRARDPRDRGRDPAALPPRAGAGLADANPPDADPFAAWRPADADSGFL